MNDDRDWIIIKIIAKAVPVSSPFLLFLHLLRLHHSARDEHRRIALARPRPFLACSSRVRDARLILS